ncbi:MAG: hypothetical protein IKP71_05900, partial [Candidatus Riflebacteria bacterium]|nr:hypothetical protein [Candidatus Riflebacteria bacterium]
INAYASASKVAFWLGPVAAAAATAAGAIQIAAIAKQHETQSAGYYEGGFTGGQNYRPEAGVVHEGEFVANHQAVKNPNLLPVLNMIDQAQRHNRVASLTAADVNRVAGGTAVAAAPQPVIIDSSSLRTAESIEKLNRMLEHPIKTYVVIDGPDGLHRNYQEYKKVLRNGKNNNKVGAMIMSEGRIFIDMSSPSKFVKNEVKPYFLYCLGMSMHPSSLEIEEDLKRTVCPPEPRDRGSIQGVNTNMGSGIAEARFGTMAYLYNYPEINSGGSYDANIEDLRNFFMPGGTALDPRFGIKDSRVRDDIIEYIKQAVRAGGDLTREEQDRIFEMAWKQSLIEEEKDYDTGCGASGLISGLFTEAVKKESDGLFIPEITINATLISSTRRASKWHIGNSNSKVNDEIGKPEEYLKKPGYIIQRVYGGDIRIGRAKPEYFVSGSHSGGNILRRRIWDNTNLTNRDFKPLEAPAVHNILTFTDEQISEKEYNNFKG